MVKRQFSHGLYCPCRAGQPLPHLVGRVGLEGVAVGARRLGARLARHHREQSAHRLTRRVQDAPQRVPHTHTLQQLSERSTLQQQSRKVQLCNNNHREVNCATIITERSTVL